MRTSARPVDFGETARVPDRPLNTFIAAGGEGVNLACEDADLGVVRDRPVRRFGQHRSAAARFCLLLPDCSMVAGR